MLVETALLLPLFLILWFGIADWGITYYVHQTIVHRANHAARWGVVHSWDPTAIRNLVIYGRTAGFRAGTYGLTESGGQGSDYRPGDFGLTPAMVNVTLRCVTKLSPALQSGSTCLANQWADTRWIEIVVHDYTWRHFTPFLFGSYTGRTVTVTLPTESLGTS